MQNFNKNPYLKNKVRSLDQLDRDLLRNEIIAIGSIIVFFVIIGYLL